MAEFGYRPRELTLNLTPGSGFNQRLRRKTGSFPTGAAAEIRIGRPDEPTATWIGVFEGAMLTFTATVAQVQALAGHQYAARVYYLEPGTQPQIWYSGRVVWNG